MKSRTRIGYWNVKTMWEGGKMRQVANEMEKYKLEILGVSETRWLGFGENRRENGGSFIYSGREEGQGHASGVGIFMSRKAKNSMMAWTPISDRIITARFKTKARPATIVQCYSPTEVATIEEKEDFYNQLSTVLNSVRKGDMVLLMGDFNAKVGEVNIGREIIMGKHGMGVVNDNGERLIEICGMFDLVIGGSLFPHKRCHKVSWVSPDHHTENQIDHFMVSRTWRGSLLDVRNKRGADVGSDHHLMVATIRLKIASVKTGKKEKTKKFNVQKLQSQNGKEQFTLELRNRFEALEIIEDCCIEDRWNATKNIFLEASKNSLGYKEPGRKDWISDDTWEAIKTRKQKKAQICNSKTRGQKAAAAREYSEANRSVKRKTRRDKRIFAENLAEKAQQAAHVGNIKELYAIAKQLSNKNFRINRPIKDAQGSLLTLEQHQLERWKQHFTEVFNKFREGEREGVGEEYEVIENQAIETEFPSRAEISEAITQLKNGKAAGIDGLPTEILKADVELSAAMLEPLLKKIWEEETLPLEWKKGILIKFPKKGDMTDCNNWRGITLLTTCSKILSRIILNRIRGPVNESLREEQAGFREGRSTTEHINTLRIILEQFSEYQAALYVLFVDFEKAFDSINQEEIWKALSSYGIPQKIIRLIKAMYEGYSCQVEHQGELSTPITVSSGVRQGCLLSPILFIMTLDSMIRKATNRNRGIQWGMHTRLEELDYADDLCLLAESFRDMEAKLNDLYVESERVGLKINTRKTNEMRLNNRNEERLTLQGVEIARVQEFCYLGCMVGLDGGADLDVENRLRKAKAAFAQLRPVWRSRQIMCSTKLRIFRSNVESVLLYGSETWKVKQNIVKKIQTYVNRCLRHIMGIRWPNVISNEDLWRITQQIPIKQKIARRKWQWIGHTLRRPQTHIARQALDWNPQGNRKRGRPKMTWRRSVEKELLRANTTWREAKALANNRDQWRDFVEALCSI